jgi:hypothetical protein
MCMLGVEIGSIDLENIVEFLVRHDQQSVQRYNCKRQLLGRRSSDGSLI